MERAPVAGGDLLLAECPVRYCARSVPGPEQNNLDHCRAPSKRVSKSLDFVAIVRFWSALTLTLNQRVQRCCYLSASHIDRHQQLRRKRGREAFVLVLAGACDPTNGQAHLACAEDLQSSCRSSSIRCDSHLIENQRQG